MDPRLLVLPSSKDILLLLYTADGFLHRFGEGFECDGGLRANATLRYYFLYS